MTRLLLATIILLTLLPFGWYDGIMELRDNGLHYPTVEASHHVHHPRHRHA